MQKQSKKINVTNVIDTMSTVGDTLNTAWVKNKDLKTIQTAIQAYGTAVSAAKAQLIYKKLTGDPSSIEFLKGE